jgi:hypothetical protein
MVERDLAARQTDVKEKGIYSDSDCKEFEKYFND